MDGNAHRTGVERLNATLQVPGWRTSFSLQLPTTDGDGHRCVLGHRLVRLPGNEEVDLRRMYNDGPTHH